jgi:hypothetical protein
MYWACGSINARTNSRIRRSPDAERVVDIEISRVLPTRIIASQNQKKIFQKSLGMNG